MILKAVDKRGIIIETLPIQEEVSVAYLIVRMPRFATTFTFYH